MTLRPLRHSDDGETLVEIIVSVFILGFAAVAIGAGMTLSIKVSDIHRKQANAGSYVRDFAESVNQSATNNYVNCISKATANLSTGSGGYVNYTPPSGYTASISQVQYLTSAGSSGSPGASAVFGATCTTDLGAQQLTIQVASNDARATEKLVVVIRKPCGPSSSCT